MRRNKNPVKKAQLSKAVVHSESEKEDIPIKKTPKITMT